MQHVSSLKSVILVTATVVVIYLAGIFLSTSLDGVAVLYALSVGANIWMTIRILKDPYSADKTFDDHFYQDRSDIRRGGKG